MKKLILGLGMFIGVVSFLNAQSTVVSNGDEVEQTKENLIQIDWQSTFKEAVKKAKKEHKPILIYFTGSDWCGPCMELDKNLFHTEKFKAYSKENMVLYLADYPRNKDLVTAKNKATNEELSRRYAQTSFPTLIMIDENGNVLGRKNGSYMVEYYYPFFEEISNNYK
ncbi:thioredoxin-like protein [Tenacibaculum adriaticum]|uniref:Thioredoxin-like protein n=1 Tax=Tenacibaculum adriaticum TaxID=413713 RepID=A0A5S5DSD4_9FLAO|nr:thioredoxin family protein [Tenacibaculum adriaticum]TYP97559.1 thioredoxin-like protein [Tenacibaculum adriaticum]